MFFSIIIATYNRKDLLRRTIDSILRQSFTNFELIIVDDGSSDGTTQMVLGIKDQRIRYFQLEKNSGAFVARNKGMEVMKGEYFIIWDSDDELYNHALEKANDILKKYPEIDMLYAPTDFFDGQKILGFQHRDSGFADRADLFSGKIPKNDAVIFLRSSVRSGLDFLGPNIDFSFYFLFSENKKIYHLNESLGKIYLHSDHLSETKKRKSFHPDLSIKRAKGLEYLLENTRDFFIKNSPNRYAGTAYGTAVGLLLLGEKKRAVYYARESWKFASIGRKKFFLFWVFTFLPFSQYLFRFFSRAYSKNKY